MAAGMKDHDRLSSDYSPLVSVRDFKALVSRENFYQSDGNDDDTTLSVSDQADIEDAISIEKLLPTGGLSVLQKTKKSAIPTDTKLNSANSASLPTVKGRLHPIAPSTTANSPSSSTISLPEVILTVFLYHPTKKLPMVSYQVYGSQTLTELRDKLFCIADYTIKTDYSENPSAFDRNSFKQSICFSKTAFFFINNVFYEDFRYSDCALSSGIFEWMSKDDQRQGQSSRLDNFTQEDMSKTTFEELNFRLGYPYLYCHHGNCEHLLVFSDIRLISPSDSLKKTDYPMLNGHVRMLRRPCRVCNEFSAIWATVEDELATEDPAYFCETCFQLLHYDKDGKKIAEFKAYPFNDEFMALLESV